MSPGSRSKFCMVPGLTNVSKITTSDADFIFSNDAYEEETLRLGTFLGMAIF